MLMRLVERRIGDQRILGLLRAWLKAGVLEDGKVSHPLRGTPQGGVISPLLANIYLHEVDRQWCTPTGTPAGQPCLIRYADDRVILTRTEQEAQHAWARLQDQLAALGLTVNEDKSRLTTVAEGFQFLGFEFRHQRGKLYLWPRTKAVKHIGERIRHLVRSVPSTASLTVVIEKLNPVLNGWCTYFRVGHSNRIFHKVDWMAREAIQLWLRRKHQLPWRTAKKRWDYRMLHEHYRLYRMVGKVSHLEGL
jgi:RNA-directed DNA polymerase